jgi:hypothetical protein
MAIPLDKALLRLQSLTPRARFFQSAEISAGRREGETEDQRFHYVSLYEHRIGNSVRPIGDYTFIIQNGFLTSHAYNVALAWLWPRRAGTGRPGDDGAVRHNYKKFFAECGLFRNNRVIVRAMLIETLMYEDGLMKPIFEASESDVEFGRLAQDIASLMSLLATRHELCHYFMARLPHEFRAHAMGLFDGAAKHAFDRAAALRGADSAEELLCDAFAAHQAMTSGDSTVAKYDPVTRARMIAFAFQVFSDLIALEMSAHATVADPRDDAIDLSSEKRPTEALPFSLGRSLDADVRAQEVVDLLAAHLSREGNTLYGTDGVLPLPESSWTELRAAFERF